MLQKETTPEYLIVFFLALVYTNKKLTEIDYNQGR